MSVDTLLIIARIFVMCLFLGLGVFLFLCVKYGEPPKTEERTPKKDDDYNNNYQNLETIMHDISDSNSHTP